MPYKDPRVAYAKKKARGQKPCSDCGKPCFFGLRCRSCSKAGNKHHFWNGGIKNTLGYKAVLIGNRHYRKEHILVMERKLGRSLKPKEVVHHWDENKRNNFQGNLQLFRSTGAHMRLHFFARRHGIKIEELKFPAPWLS